MARPRRPSRPIDPDDLTPEGTASQGVAERAAEASTGWVPRSLDPDLPPYLALLQSLRELACAHPHTRGIEDFVISPRPFPVDIRHQSKILREKLLSIQ